MYHAPCHQLSVNRTIIKRWRNNFLFEKVSRCSSTKEIKDIKVIKGIKEIILGLENSSGIVVHLAEHGDQVAFAATGTALAASGLQASTACRYE